jgi:hypothetical protein
MSRQVSTLTLDGDRISADLVVQFQRAVGTATAESIADEIAKAATEILGEQITQGAVRLSKDELATRISARISASAVKSTWIDVKAIQLVGSETNAYKSTYRTRHASPPPPAAGHAYESGVVPTIRRDSALAGADLTPPEPPRVRTRWPRALASCEPGAPLGELGLLLGPALRDSVAAAILHVFVAVDPEVTDRMELFSGGEVVDAILLEVCACFVSAIYRIFSAQGMDLGVATELAHVAVSQVVVGGHFPGAQVDHYRASDSPVRDLAVRIAAALGAPETGPAIQAAVSPYCEALRDDLRSVAGEVLRLIA